VAQARPTAEPRDPDISRITAFSDCVFSIAMTLLVVSLEIPKIHGNHIDRDLRQFLSQEWGQLLGYALSFYVIARFWLAHHRLFRFVRAADTRLITLNLLLLGFVAFLPYPTGIMGRYGQTTTAVVFYAATMAATGIMSAALWDDAVRTGAVAPDSPPAKEHDRWMMALLPGVFLLSIPVAFIDAEAASMMWSLLFVTRLARRRQIGHRAAA